MAASFSRNFFWLLFFSAVLLAWWVMFEMANMVGVDWAGRPVRIPAMSMSILAPVAAMWAIMMAAMMFPPMVPTLRSYNDLIASADGTRTGWLGVLAGYFIVWVGFALLIAASQVGLIRMGVLDRLGAAVSLWLTAFLFVAVGLYQFSRIKEICHGVCDSPTVYFLGHWQTGGMGGVRMGLGLGVYCVGCCWGYMALGFTGGVMNLLWMGLATLFMVLEKLPQIGRHVLKPSGVVLIGAGVYFGLRAANIV